MPKVSIIVPVYNVEKYIEKCLETLINQTLQDIEIILVDDGSRDKSGEFCDAYGEGDKRIKVIHKINGGLGFARNSGLDAASGEYVAFADSDDYVSLDMYEKLYNEVKIHNADVCLCGINKVSEAGEIKVFNNPLNNSVFEKDELLPGVLANMLGAPPDYLRDDYVGMSSCTGLYSNRVISRYNIRFCSEREFISEDAIFNIDFFSHGEKAVTIADALYYYRYNSSSLTKSYKQDRFQQCKKLYEEILRRIDQLGILDTAKVNLDRTFIANSRVCIIQEVINADINGIAKARKNVYNICSDSLLQQALCTYPVFKLPIKQRIFTAAEKFKLVSLLFYLVRLNS